MYVEAVEDVGVEDHLFGEGVELGEVDGRQGGSPGQHSLDLGLSVCIGKVPQGESVLKDLGAGRDDDRGEGGHRGTGEEDKRGGQGGGGR